MEQKNLIDRIIEIDNEIEKIKKNITHGLPEKLFRKKIIKALYENNIVDEIHTILTSMNNSELAITMNLTDNIMSIEYIPKYMSEAFVDYKRIKKDPEYLINEYYRIIDQDEAIASMSTSKENYEIVRDRANIKKIEKYLLEAMSNEQLKELADSSPDWNEKLHIYGFLKNGEKPCKFKKQKNGKYYVVKVKYISVKDDNEYLYICNDDSIKKGNKIMVTSYTGFALDIKAAKVLEVSYYDKEELPISLEESEEVIGKVNSDDELSDIKYSFGKLKCFDEEGNEVPFFDPDIDRQCYLTSVKIADELTSRLADSTKANLADIPNFELVPRDFKKIIIDEFISLEPLEIRKIDGLEDEISDYILFNVKHEDCYELTIDIVNNVINDIDESTFENLLSDTFEEHNEEFIEYIKDNYVVGNHPKLDCEDEWLATRVFNRLIVKLQQIKKRMIEEEKYNKSLFRYNFRDINRKLVEFKDTSDKFDNLGIKGLTNPFIAYVYLDIDRGLNVRIVGNKDNDKLNKRLCTEECVLLRHDTFLNYEASIFTDKLETYNLDEQIETYYSHENIERARAQSEIDNLRSTEYPDDVELVIPFKERPEKLWGRAIDYILDDKIYIVYLLNDSYVDEEIKLGEYAACEFMVLDNKEEILLFKGLLKKD